MTSRILIADDTETILDYLELVFEKSGFETIPARGGKHAIARAKETNPDLVLVDVMMPDVDGFDVCRQLRSDPATHQLPILLYSAVVGEEVRARAMAAGADEFLGKSLHHAELVDRVRDWLASRSLPGGVGDPGLVEVGLDLLALLEVELVWLLAEDHDGEFQSLAVISERGEQEARRFAETVKDGPLRAGPSTILGALFEHERVRTSWSLEDVGVLEGGGRLQDAMGSLGVSEIIAAPLLQDEAQRAAMIASGRLTLAWSSKQSRHLTACLRYLSLALERKMGG